MSVCGAASALAVWADSFPQNKMFTSQGSILNGRTPKANGASLPAGDRIRAFASYKSSGEPSVDVHCLNSDFYDCPHLHLEPLVAAWALSQPHHPVSIGWLRQPRRHRMEGVSGNSFFPVLQSPLIVFVWHWTPPHPTLKLISQSLDFRHYEKDT